MDFDNLFLQVVQHPKGADLLHLAAFLKEDSGCKDMDAILLLAFPCRCLPGLRRLGCTDVILLRLFLGGIGILCLPEINIRVIAVGYLHLPEEILGIIPQLLAAHVRLTAIIQLVHLNADKIHRIQHDIRNGCGIHLLRMQLTDIVENILYRVCQG